MSTQLRLDRSPHAVRLARYVARDWLFSHPHIWEAEHNLELVVAELVANAVVHGEAPIVLALEDRETTICVEVSDASAEFPPVPTSRDRGFGLRIVEQLSRRSGVTREPGDGKTVWAEL
jgi:anti-sigma regulatory factor (Ser/Thr protein kinase)